MGTLDTLSTTEEWNGIPWWIILIVGSIVSLILYWLYDITHNSFWSAWFSLSVASTVFLIIFAIGEGGRFRGFQ